MPQPNTSPKLEAPKLLDEIFMTLQSPGLNPTLSATNKAYNETVSLIEKALSAQYDKGRKEAIEEFKKAELNKQRNQN